MFYASCVFAVAFAFPMFWLLNTKDPLTITLTVIAAIIFGQIVGFQRRRAMVFLAFAGQIAL